ncbi:MAG: ActS/PrrB/RegB family redox-sensitive histidine kinase [Maricaulaceae bacterium]|jgi:two-component system sensor histidine kinase RegB
MSERSTADPLAPTERRVRARVLLLLRWMAVAGQTATVLAVEFVLRFDLNLAACLGVISASAWLNIFLAAASPGQRLMDEREAAAQLAFDIVQLAVLIGLTGGLDNPFVLLLGVPVMIASTILRPAPVIGLGALAFAASLVMAAVSAPLPWDAAEAFNPPPLYAAGLWTALVSGTGFMSVFAWRLAADARAMSTALAATEAVLAREQRLSALGGLAAAAAHELGTPLGTIHLVAKEMAQSAPPGSEMAQDAELLVQQSQRCRDILGQLARRGDAGDAVHARISLAALIDEAIEPVEGAGAALNVVLQPLEGADETPPALKRSPEILYAIANLADNAVDYAASEVIITGRWTPDWVEIEIVDDGPGFSDQILTRLGEPYAAAREHASRRGGLGLGFFIAKTFIERSGGALVYANRRGPQTGALVRARWPLEAVRDE